MPLQAIKLGLDQLPVSCFLRARATDKNQRFGKTGFIDLGPHDRDSELPALALAALALGIW